MKSCKGFRLKLLGTEGFDNAQVTTGGIRTGGNSISGLPAGSLSLGTSDGGVYLSISPSGIDIKGNVTITGDLTVTGGVVNLN